MPTTSRIAARRRCGWSARARPTCSPRFRPAFAPCGARCTAGPTRPASRCSKQIQADGGNVKKYVELAKDKRRRLPPDGLRPSRLQELRPAGDDHQSDVRQAAQRSERSTIRSSTSPRSWRKRPCRIRTSSSASFIRTSISIPASSTGRWAFRCRCSRCCSPSAACPAGSPIGWRCTIRRTKKSAGRGKSTPAQRSAIMLCAANGNGWANSGTGPPNPRAS